MKLLSMVQGSQEWLLFRRSKIGASDASSILGLSPYSTAYEVWRSKVFGIDQIMNANMAFGKKNESIARDLFEEMTGNIMLPDKIAQHDTRDWQIASLDGIDLDETMFVEIKCANALDHAMAKEGKVPPKYIPQLQHQFSVTGLDTGFYFSYNKGEGIIVEVHPDKEFMKMMVRLEDQFYNINMIHKYPPELVQKDIKKYEQLYMEYLDARTT